uniref:Putative secreted protein n=1 Tax=Anopheles triannulatus TaxID=58253 RepID=A0A2M4B2C1_9DIPT
MPPSVNNRRLFASAAFAITCGSTASSRTNGRCGPESSVCMAFRIVSVRSVSQESSASTTPTSRLCCPVNASRQRTISVMRLTSAPSAVSGAASLLENACFRCLPCDMNSALVSFDQACKLAMAPASRKPSNT